MADMRSGCDARRIPSRNGRGWWSEVTEPSVHYRRCAASDERPTVATTPVMWIHLSLALLLQAAPRLEPSIASTRTVSTTTKSAKEPSGGAVIEAANNAVIGFLAIWRTAWHSSGQ